jgi:hypothetical protein
MDWGIWVIVLLVYVFRSDVRKGHFCFLFFVFILFSSGGCVALELELGAGNAGFLRCGYELDRKVDGYYL